MNVQRTVRATAALLLMAAGCAKIEPHVSRHLVCGDYARRAVGHQQENVRMGCGYSGAEWSVDESYHFQWCLAADPTTVQQTERQRVDQLVACMKSQLPAGGAATTPGSPASKESWCRLYAETALHQADENIRRGCGFTGPDWERDSDRHFQWCMSAPKGAVDQKVAERERELESCGGSTLPPGKAEAVYEPASTEARCEAYAKEAVAQYQEGVRLGCSFKGAEWNPDFNYHYRWCLKVPEVDAQRGSKMRKDQLEECRGGRAPALPPGKGEAVYEPVSNEARCTAYAQEAVAQYQEGVRLGCSFKGAEWNPDFNYHYRWCLKVSEADAQRGSKMRKDQLEECRGARPPALPPGIGGMGP